MGLWEWGEGKMGKENGEGEDWVELMGMEWLRWRKSLYGINEEDILLKGAILGLVRDLCLQRFPGVQGDFPS